jgi:hypothetical protein
MASYIILPRHMRMRTSELSFDTSSCISFRPAYCISINQYLSKFQEERIYYPNLEFLVTFYNFDKGEIP